MVISTFGKGNVLTSPRPTSSHALPSNFPPPPLTPPSIHCSILPLHSCVLPLLAHHLSGVNHSISISPRGKSPLLLLTSSGINAGCQRRVGDSELPRVDCQVAWERIQRGRSRYIIYIRVFTSRMDSAQQNITLSGFQRKHCFTWLYAMCT